MDGGEGWWDLDLGGPECDGGGVKVWIRKKPQKKLIFVLSVYDLCCCVCVCVCLFYVPPSLDLVKDVCESLFDNVTKGWRESEKGIQSFFVYYRHCESKGDSGGGGE
jgi:hypothetical protein